MEPNETPFGEQRPAPVASKPRGRLAFGAALVVVIAIVAAFAAVLLAQQGALMPPQQTGPAATRDWQVYHDPLGLFTMRLPPGWTASSSLLGTFTEGNRTESMSGQEENVRFSDRALGAASSGIFVNAQQMNKPAVARSMWCSPHSGQPSTFNGYPADESSPALILFNSADAHFQIAETIPGVLAPPSVGGSLNWAQQPQPTPLPSATVIADRSLLSDALGTFQPTNPHPLSCP